MKPQHTPVLFFVVVFTGLVVFLFLKPNAQENKDHVWRLDLAQQNKHQIPENWTRELNLTHLRERNGAFWQTTPSGVQVQTTLDPALQIFFEQEFTKYELPYAAAVVIHLPDGEVRALAGRSQADPRLTPGELALTPWAPAASLFKIITALALLSDPSFDPQETVCFSGGKSGIQEHHMIDPPPENKKTVCENLETALANSSNVVFGKLARRRLNVRRLQEVAAACGFNQSLPFEFEVERSMFRLSEDDPDPMALPRTAAGFGHTSMSPYHAAWLAAFIAADGVAAPIHMIQRAWDPSGHEIFIKRPQQEVIPRFPDVSKLRRMLATTVETGTAREGFFRGEQRLVPVSVGGKTGTLTRQEPAVLTYSWFIGYFPVDNARWAFSVLVVNPEKWRTKAAHISARLVNRLLELEKEAAKTTMGD